MAGIWKNKKIDDEVFKEILDFSMQIIRRKNEYSRDYIGFFFKKLTEISPNSLRILLETILKDVNLSYFQRIIKENAIRGAFHVFLASITDGLQFI